MHPMERIIVLLALCQIVSLIQTIRHVQSWAGKSITPDEHIIYWLKVGPLGLAVVLLAGLVLRVLGLLPWFVV